MKMPQENLLAFCAAGVSCREERIELSDGVSLRTVTFEPPSPGPWPAVVFVPGWITLPAAWKEVLREITRDFTVHYIETREKISSRVRGRKEYSVEALGRDVAAYVARLGLPEDGYVLFGSSLGATVILDCLRFLRARPKALVLVGPNAVFRMPFWGKAFVFLVFPPLYGWIKPFVKWYLRTFRLDLANDMAQYKKYCDNLDAADAWKLRRAALAFASYEVWGLLPDIRIPALIAGASKDKLHEPENLKRMAALMPAAVLEDFGTNQGTHSAALVVAVRRFLSGLPGKSL